MRSSTLWKALQETPADETRSPDPQLLATAFDELDANGDGWISAAELKQALEKGNILASTVTTAHVNKVLVGDCM